MWFCPVLGGTAWLLAVLHDPTLLPLVVAALVAALLFLTLVVLAASASGGGDDNAAAAAVEKKEKRCYGRLAADEPYALVAFQNSAGDEIRLFADQRSSELLSSVSAFANRSGHWFYFPVRQEDAGKGTRRRLVPRDPRSRAEGFWNTLGVLVNTDDDEQAAYMLVGMQTSGGEKIRLVVVADHRYFYITGFAQGFFWQPNWFFRDGEPHRLLPTLGGSHAEVVAFNVLAALTKVGKAFCG